MKICVVGTGYVGLVSGTCFANSGNDVYCVDRDAAKIEKLKQLIMPIYEPGLKELVEHNVAAKRLRFTTSMEEGLRNCQIVYICVGTPQSEDGSADLRAVWSVANDIRRLATEEKLVVIKSTVPVGTNQELTVRLNDGAAIRHRTASNPEFLKEGQAINDFLKPERVIAGVRDKRSGDQLTQLYAPYLRSGRPMLVMTPESAEMSKYAANAMLATKISFINEMANLCEEVGASIDEVRQGMGHDSRIGFQFLHPGPGYGGSCFPKDVVAIRRTAVNAGRRLRVLEAVEDANESQKERVYLKLIENLGANLSGVRIAIWGLAFKACTDDIRESPAVVLIRRLLNANASVTVFDPAAMENVKEVFGSRLTYAEDMYSTLDGADALAILTEWNEFRTPDFELISQKLRRPIVIDGRNLFTPAQMQELGFIYASIGRATVNAPQVSSLVDVA